MENLDEIETGSIKMGERCEYVPLEEVRKQQELEQKQCAEMLKKPGEVAIGPIEQCSIFHFLLGGKLPDMCVYSWIWTKFMKKNRPYPH